VSTLQGSPIQLAQFLALLERREDRHTDIATVQYIGSALSATLVAKIHDVLGASVTACYGSTEVGMIALRRDVTDNLSDVGPPLPGIQVEVVDENDEPIPVGGTGVLRVRTARRDTGYFGAPVTDVVRDGWFYPGDLASLSPDGHIVLAGRASEIINAGGVKFNPEVGDEVLLAHPGVTDGAIIPFDSPLGVTGYAAVVVADDGVDLTALIDPLRDACGGAAPATIFRVGTLVRDHNGKVSRTALARTVDRSHVVD
jgi:acyl-coenzyme A synthetase/AMP-(fatty) acid ligase